MIILLNTFQLYIFEMMATDKMHRFNFLHVRFFLLTDFGCIRATWMEMTSIRRRCGAWHISLKVSFEILFLDLQLGLLIKVLQYKDVWVY